MPRALTSLAALALVASCGPSQECRDYVACQGEVDDHVDVGDYEEDGACWALPSTARACTATCVQALAALQETPAAPDACFPDGPADSENP
jgi:hypothetical protein